MNKTYILYYHALESSREQFESLDAEDASVVVRENDFRAQLQLLSESGTRVLTLNDILNGPQSSCGDSPPRDSLKSRADLGHDVPTVVFTFDDGHRSNWSVAMPTLLDAGMTATFYIVAGWVDHDSRYLTSSQVRELAENGMHIGSHTMTHAFLPQLSPVDVCGELLDSKNRLEDILGQPVADLALPGGHADDFIFDMAKQCGYRSVATCKVGTYRLGDDPLHLPRIEVRRGLSIEAFRQTFRSSKLRQLQMLEFGKNCLRHSLGLGRYTRLRRLAHRCVSLKR